MNGFIKKYRWVIIIIAVGIAALDDFSGNAAQEIAVLGQNAGI